jgi:hypothetical protein
MTSRQQVLRGKGPVAEMAEQRKRITGQVAEILDEYSLAINRGENDGVEVGMIFSVMGLGGDIIDPEKKTSLGPKPVEKLRVKVTDVFEKYSVAETYRIVQPPSITSMMSDYRQWEEAHRRSMFDRIGPPQPQRQRLADEPPPRARENPVVKVEVGDVVRELKH